MTVSFHQSTLSSERVKPLYSSLSFMHVTNSTILTTLSATEHRLLAAQTLVDREIIPFKRYIEQNQLKSALPGYLVGYPFEKVRWDLLCSSMIDESSVLNTEILAEVIQQNITQVDDGGFQEYLERDIKEGVMMIRYYRKWIELYRILRTDYSESLRETLDKTVDKIMVIIVNSLGANNCSMEDRDKISQAIRRLRNSINKEVRISDEMRDAFASKFPIILGSFTVTFNEDGKTVPEGLKLGKELTVLFAPLRKHAEVNAYLNANNLMGKVTVISIESQL